MVGGKGILSALKRNFTINKLQITGNNIPEEIVEAISIAIIVVLQLMNESINLIEISKTLKWHTTWNK